MELQISYMKHLVGWAFVVERMADPPKCFRPKDAFVTTYITMNHSNLSLIHMQTLGLVEK